jgi:lysozyme
MAPTGLSLQGAAFTVDGESCPERAYKDIGGVVTIGPGLTMLSRTFAEYWQKTRGHGLRIGDTLPRKEAMTLFHKVMAQEYVPPVLANIKPKEQHHLDAGADMSWNCGPASTKWKWAAALRDGLIKQSVALLMKTAVTVNGKGPIKGLVNRRRRQARLIEFADYGHAGVSTEGGVSGIASTVEEIKEIQGWLTKLGYYKGDIDGKGIGVKGSLTDGAIRNFQRATPGLKVDGVPGPATRNALVRAVSAIDQKNVAIGGTTASGGGLLGLDLEPWMVIAGAVGVVILLVLAFWIWNNRGVILRRRITV